MKRIGRGILWLTLALGPLFATTPATAAIYFDEQGLKGNLGEVQVRGRFSVSAQGALIEPLDKGGDRQDGELDGEARINLEYISDSAVLFGLAGEVDTGNDDINDFERGELYAYMAADWGRLELGENDGPADTLSFHAPVVGLGQVRGDFARYIGSAALLSPYDTRDAGKITYLSPPFNGLRGGISYAPDFRINAGDPEPRRRYIQNDAFELAGQYYTLINASV
ncbi:MAG: porin, partial [Gammaproteobacteria bacterium]|nr:porin [Gammaproteobacteria bacterium]